MLVGNRRASMNTVIFICGLYSVGFGIFHILFWRIFDWKNDLKKLKFANRGIIQVLNLCLIYFFLLVGFLCFIYPEELLHTTIGNAFLTAISLFWFGRTIEQFIFFRTNNKYVHLLTIVFAIGTILFALPLFMMQ
jgi:hypothetical protein